RCTGPSQRRSCIPCGALASASHLVAALLLSSLLERNLVGIDIPRHVLGHSRQVVDRRCGDCRADPRASRLEELDVGGHNLSRAPLLAVLAFPGSGLESALDVDEGPLAEVVGDLLGEVSLADVPGD